MGKVMRWLRGLLGMKKCKENMADNSNFRERKERKNGGLREIPAADTTWVRYLIADSDEQEKHVIAVADAAVAAAQAAVAVVRLASNGGGGGALFTGGRERLAAVKIQTYFRGYLARKARRALRGLVKLQALVRGFLVRKRAAAILQRMEALIRAQHMARSRRAPGFTKIMENKSGSLSKRYDESPKIVEMDTCRPKTRSRRMSSCFSDDLSKKYGLDHQGFDWGFVPEEWRFPTAQNTPRFGFSGTPAKSVCGDWNCPNYMASTQSFKAKLRSQSAPKQRPGPGRNRRLSSDEIVASRTSFGGVRMQRSCNLVEEDFEF